MQSDNDKKNTLIQQLSFIQFNYENKRHQTTYGSDNKMTRKTKINKYFQCNAVINIFRIFFQQG